ALYQARPYLRSRSPTPIPSVCRMRIASIRNHATSCCSAASGKYPPPSTSTTCPYCALVLSAKLARRARPPLGVCQPHGLVFPLTSVVERMTSLSGCRFPPLGAEAPARTSQQARANITLANTRDSSDFMRESLPGKRRLRVQRERRQRSLRAACEQRQECDHGPRCGFTWR